MKFCPVSLLYNGPIIREEVRYDIRNNKESLLGIESRAVAELGTRQAQSSSQAYPLGYSRRSKPFGASQERFRISYNYRVSHIEFTVLFPQFTKFFCNSGPGNPQVSPGVRISGWS
jgi:hypothetical protein